ncbi:MAG TPA: transposase [Dehalococcoidia bacterium]|nr:transposase [Dehalococcoidia bacterium]
MGTRNHPIQINQPYFVTTITRKRQPIFRDHHAAGLFLAELGRLRSDLGFALLGYAVMPDHVHLVVVPADSANLREIMRLVKGSFARLWNQRCGQSGSLWQPRYYESAVRTEQQLVQWLKYIDDNPVRAGLASSPQQYPYGSPGGRLMTDLTAYLDGSWIGQAEARPSGERVPLDGPGGRRAVGSP